MSDFNPFDNMMMPEEDFDSGPSEFLNEYDFPLLNVDNEVAMALQKIEQSWNTTTVDDLDLDEILATHNDPPQEVSIPVNHEAYIPENQNVPIPENFVLKSPEGIMIHIPEGIENNVPIDLVLDVVEGTDNPDFLGVSEGTGDDVPLSTLLGCVEGTDNPDFLRVLSEGTGDDVPLSTLMSCVEGTDNPDFLGASEGAGDDVPLSTLLDYNDEPDQQPSVADSTEFASNCCAECLEYLGSRAALLNHMRVAHGKDSPNIKPIEADTYKHFTCDACEVTFNSRKQIRRHYKLVHSRKLRKHVKSSQLVNCILCSAQFRSVDVLNRHMKRVHTVKRVEVPAQIFRCQSCDKTFKAVQLLINHTKDSHSDTALRSAKTYNCELCDVMFVHEHQLEEHMKNVHTDSVERFSLTTCTFCDNWFSSQHALEVHLKKEHQEQQDEEMGPFKCHLCPRSYFLEYSLQRHMNVVHKMSALMGATSRVLFSCELCGASFMDLKLLQRHFLEHPASKFTMPRFKLRPFYEMDEKPKVKADHNLIRKYGDSEVLKSSNNASMKDKIGHDGVLPPVNGSVQSSGSVIPQRSTDLKDRREKVKLKDLSYSIISQGAKVLPQVGRTRTSNAEAAQAKQSCPVKLQLFAHILQRKKKVISGAIRVKPPSKQKTTRFKCAFCLSSFSKQHKCKVQLTEPTSCLICDQEFPSHEVLIQHTKKHHPELTIPTQKILPSSEKSETEQSVSFNLELDMNEESDLHFENTCCNVCDKVFLRKEALDEHVQELHPDSEEAMLLTLQREAKILGDSETSEDDDDAASDDDDTPLHCAPCDLKFTSVAKLSEHNKSAHTENFSCVTCGKNFEALTQLTNHLNTVHSADLKTPCEPEDEPHDEHPSTLMCQTCGIVVTSKHKMVEHMLAEHCVALSRSKTVIACDVCDFHCVTEAELMEHSSKHVRCELCKQPFASMHVLAAHMVTHITCELCDLPLASEDALDLHMTTCHFTCSVCNVIVATKSDLNEHTRSTHEASATLDHPSAKPSQPVAPSCVVKGAPSNSKIVCDSKGWVAIGEPGKRKKDNVKRAKRDTPGCVQPPPSSETSTPTPSNKEVPCVHIKVWPRSQPQYNPLQGLEDGGSDFEDGKEKETEQMDTLTWKKKLFKTMVCTICKQNFSSINVLHQHCEAQHADVVLEYKWKVKGCNGIYQCNICKASFASRVLLINHKFRHRGILPFACKWCDRTFAYQNALEKHCDRFHLAQMEVSRRQMCGENVQDITVPEMKQTHEYMMVTKRDAAHKNTFVLVCSVCKRRFKKAFLLYKHCLLEHMSRQVTPVVKLYRYGKNRCGFCGVGYARRVMLWAHLLRHFDILPYMCKCCGRLFGHKNALFIHVRRYHALQASSKSHTKLNKLLGKDSPQVKEDFTCDFCGLHTLTRGKMMRHILKCHLEGSDVVHTTKDPDAVVTSLTMESVAAEQAAWFDFHPTVENEADPLQCSLCPVSYIRKHLLERHAREMHAGESFPCSKCYMVFKEQCTLFEHEAASHGWLKQRKVGHQTVARPRRKMVKHQPKKHQVLHCDICGELHAGKEQLENHMRLHLNLPFYCRRCRVRFHGIQKLDTHFCDEVKFPHLCIHCGRRFKQRASLLLHRDKHIRKVACEHCDKRFVNAQRYAQHKARYHRVKKLLCSECGLQFTHQKELDCHLKKHREMPYACKHCPRKFWELRQMRQHMNLDHTMELYVCHICGTALSQKGHYLVHMKHHRGEQLNYACKICKKSYTSRNALRYHIKTRHPEMDLKAIKPIKDKNFIAKALETNFHTLRIANPESEGFNPKATFKTMFPYMAKCRR